MFMSVMGEIFHEVKDLNVPFNEAQAAQPS